MAEGCDLGPRCQNHRCFKAHVCDTVHFSSSVDGITFSHQCLLEAIGRQDHGSKSFVNPRRKRLVEVEVKEVLKQKLFHEAIIPGRI